MAERKVVAKLVAEVARLTADVELMEGVIRGLWHHVPDRGKAVGDLTAEQKDRYADAVEASSRRDSEDPVTVKRWWRDAEVRSDG